MRIATVCFSKTQGGLELATLRAGGQLLAHGHHVVAVLPHAPELAGQAERLGLRVECITPSFSYLAPLAARKLRALIAREELELLLVGRTRDLSTAMLAAGRAVAVVLYQQMRAGRDKHDRFHDRVFQRLDGCITLTRRDRESMVANTTLAPEKIAVIPYGIDTGHFSPASCSREESRRKFGIPPDAFVVGIVGGFDPGKGQKEFLEGIRTAVERRPALQKSLWAMLVGERRGDRREYTTQLRALRDSLSFASQVILHPFVEDPRLAYRALDVFVLASHSETFGMVLQEALAMGVASIGTNSGGVPEILAHEENGLLIPPRDSDAIAAAILRLHDDAALRTRLAAAGRESAQRKYDPKRQYDALEQALAKALERRRMETKA